MKYLKVFTDFTIDMESLNDAERGRLFVAMLEYAAEGTPPSLQGNERFLWGSAKKMIDAQQKAYEHRCEINRQNGNEPKRIAANRSESLRFVAIGSESLQEQEQEQEQESVCEKSAHAHTQEDLILANFEKWCSQYAPTLLQFAEPMTAIQLDELRKKNSDAKIKECAAQVHNKSAYATNRSAFLTMRKWMANMRAN